MTSNLQEAEVAGACDVRKVLAVIFFITQIVLAIQVWRVSGQWGAHLGAVGDGTDAGVRDALIANVKGIATLVASAGMVAMGVLSVLVSRS